MVPVGAGHGSGIALAELVCDDMVDVLVTIDVLLVIPDPVEVVPREVVDEVEAEGSFFAPMNPACGRNLTFDPWYKVQIAVVSE